MGLFPFSADVIILKWPQTFLTCLADAPCKFLLQLTDAFIQSDLQMRKYKVIYQAKEKNK